MREDRSPEGPPRWKALIVTFGAVVAWPVFVAPMVSRAKRFRRLVREARPWNYRVVADGVEVWRDPRTTRVISWTSLGKGRWFVHFSPSLASQADESYAVDLPQEGVVLAGDLLSVRKGLRERQIVTDLHDGGRGLGAAGWLLTMLWVTAALTALLVYLWHRRIGH